MTAQLTHQSTQIKSTGTSHGPLRRTWYRIGQAIREMNYATRRVVEVQAPWIVDEQWHSR
jgi:hypothetical protein